MRIIPLLLFLFMGFLSISQEVVEIDRLISHVGEEIHPDSMISRSEIILIKSEKINYKPGIYSGLYLKGRAFVIKGDYQKALLLFLEMYRMVINNPDSLVIENQIKLAQVYNYMGMTYQEMGIYDKSFENYMKALRIAEKHKLNKILAGLYNNIGNVYFSKQVYNLARDYFVKALNINSKEKNYTYLFDNLNNIGGIFQRTGQYDSAVFYLDRASHILPGEMLASESTILLSNLGQVHFDRGEYELGLSYLDSALQIALRNGMKPSVVSFLVAKADMVLKMGNSTKSLQFAQQAYKVSRQLGVQNYRKDAAYQMAVSYEKAGMPGKAIPFYKEYINLNDSIFSHESEQRIMNFQISYETEQKEKEISFLRNINLKQKKIQTLLYSVSLTFALLALSLFTLFFISRRLLKQRQQIFEQETQLNELEIAKKDKENQLLKEEQVRKEMEKMHLEESLKKEQEIFKLETEKFQAEILHKSRELASSVLHTTHKNELLEDIKTHLRNLKQSDKSETDKMLRSIESSFHLDKDWEQFKYHFDHVHQQFFVSLKNYYPEITENELKLCAYLRINLNTKEIAQMLNVTIAAVNKSRQRLRKKLQLVSDANLNEFLMGIE